ncbi:hypothetical protein [Bosea beijingensis]|uniref:hypothetical protein n=1 Tax=Bosea beijingensis TaxID=3068632 RepID=UPI0027428DE6|nr:hypothetical protein [Bosea sp. REN20]
MLAPTGFRAAGGAGEGNVSRKRAAIATVVGNALEWFDFAIYAFLATSIAKNFFRARTKRLL